jgi:Family of unknown function (DUF6338)
MIPETFAALYAFLGLVAPGLIYQILREKRRPAVDETAFREASRIALTSLVFTTVATLLMTLLGVVAPGLFPDIAAWITTGKTYF